jgi:DNA-binding response OmpR family regulator
VTSALQPRPSPLNEVCLEWLAERRGERLETETNVQHMNRAYGLGVNSYLVKPHSMAELAGVLVLDRQLGVIARISDPQTSNWALALIVHPLVLSSALMTNANSRIVRRSDLRVALACIVLHGLTLAQGQVWTGGKFVSPL